jgi:hypothetical protein
MSKERARRREVREHEAARRAAARQRELERQARSRSRRRTLTGWVPRPHFQPGVLAARRRTELMATFGLLLLVNLVVWLVRPDWAARLGALVVSVVVVTGPPDAGVVAAALAERLGFAHVSLGEIEDELAVDAADTPRAWLRYDAEQEVVRRLTDFCGTAVLDVAVEPPLEGERVRALVRRWWEDVVEVRCEAPGLRSDGLGAARTVVLDASRALAVGEIAAVVRPETTSRRRERHPG